MNAKYKCKFYNVYCFYGKKINTSGVLNVPGFVVTIHMFYDFFSMNLNTEEKSFPAYPFSHMSW